MLVNKEKILYFLHKAVDLQYNNFIIAQSRPLPPPESNAQSTRFPRLIIPLHNPKPMRYACNNSICERDFLPGEVLICPGDAWSQELWHKPHQMLSLVFHERFIRTIYIDQHQDSPPRPLSNGPDIFYHSINKLNLQGVHTLQALCNATADSPATYYNFMAMLKIVIENIEQPNEEKRDRSRFLWECIQEYIERSFSQELSRYSIAKDLRITPSHLSRLVHKYTGSGVNEYLTRIRMEHALHLLGDKSISVDEIATQCGYNYTSYFIRIFRKYFGDSPGDYRNRKSSSQM